MPEIDTKPLCHRVVVNETGLALPPAQACLEYGIVARVIFVRNDGWALGAPDEYEHVAAALWKDQWVSFARWPDYLVTPISLYRSVRIADDACESIREPELEIHLLDGMRAACGAVHGHPVEWPTEPVRHTWVRLDRAWRITCQRCREVAMARLAVGRKHT